MDVDLPLVNNMHVVPEPHEELGFNTGISHGLEFLGAIHDYIC